MFMDPEIAYFLMEKTKKQEYLKIEVADLGYDTVEFAQFLEAKRCKCESIAYILLSFGSAWSYSGIKPLSKNILFNKV